MNKANCCSRCWPETSPATYQGCYGYDRLCEGCYRTLNPANVTG